MNSSNSNKFYLLVVGSRNFNDFNLLNKKLDKALSNYKDFDIEIVSGGAYGADHLAEQYALEHGYSTKIFPITKADWDKYGKKAGYLRNKAMHEYIAQFPNRGVVAFWDGQSKGTQHSFVLSKLYNNPIRIVKSEEDFTNELDFDTDTIEEYEEFVTHYGKVKKHVEAPVVVRKAKQEELDRIDRILAKRRENVDELANVVNYIEQGYDALEDYIETRDAMAEEYSKRYTGNKSKACSPITVDKFENKAIYTLKFIFKLNEHEETLRFFKTMDYLKKQYREEDVIVKSFGNITKVYLLEESSFDKDLDKYSSNQLYELQDHITTLLKSGVEKLVFTNEDDIKNAIYA